MTPIHNSILTIASYENYQWFEQRYKYKNIHYSAIDNQEKNKTVQNPTEKWLNKF